MEPQYQDLSMQRERNGKPNMRWLKTGVIQQLASQAGSDVLVHTLSLPNFL